MRNLFTAKVKLSLVVALAGLALAGCEDVRLTSDNLLKSHEYLSRETYADLAPLPHGSRVGISPLGNVADKPMEVDETRDTTSKTYQVTRTYQVTVWSDDQDYPPYSPYSRR